MRVELDDIFQVSSVSGLAHTIQLALAPAFLLSAMGIILNMLTGRLTRIVDRARVIEREFTPRDHPNHAHQVNELRLLDRRMKIVNNAIFLATASAVVLCTVVAVMFLAELVGFSLARALATLFAVSLVLLIASLVMFLVEVRLAVRAIEIRDELLERSLGLKILPRRGRGTGEAGGGVVAKCFTVRSERKRAPGSCAEACLYPKCCCSLPSASVRQGCGFVANIRRGLTFSTSSALNAASQSRWMVRRIRVAIDRRGIACRMPGVRRRASGRSVFLLQTFWLISMRSFDTSSRWLVGTTPPPPSAVPLPLRGRIKAASPQNERRAARPSSGDPSNMGQRPEVRPGRPLAFLTMVRKASPERTEPTPKLNHETSVTSFR
jgi:hypothetical protein